MAVATPCWPAPVSAITRCLPMRSTSKRLAEAVVDLVRAGVEQVFALQIDFCAAEFLRETAGEEQRRGAAGILSGAGSPGAAGTCDRVLPSRIRAPIPRARPSAFPGRSGRHRRRNVRRHARVLRQVRAQRTGANRVSTLRELRLPWQLLSSRCLIHGPHSLNERADFSRIFLAGLMFHA